MIQITKNNLMNVIAAGLGLLTTLAYLIYNLILGSFAIEIFLMLILGTASAALSLFKNYKFLPIAMTLFFALAFGLYLNNRVIMFEEIINHITGMTERGQILGVVVAILVANLLAAIASVVASFRNED